MKRELNYKIKIMEKKELKNELKDIKAKIKANSVDAHFADTLISELLSIKGRLDHEPTLAHLPLDNIEDSFKDDTFEIYVMRTGEVVYHLKGGYTVIVDTRFHALNATLRDYVLNQKNMDSLSDEDKELYSNDLFATTMILNLATIAFSDLEYKYKIYGNIIDWLAELQEKLITNAELQDETPEENEAFDDANNAIEVLHDGLDNMLES